jgi:hypothetical protein
LLIQVFLKTSEHFANLLRFAKVGHGIGNRVVVFQAQQRRQLFLVEFFYADGNVVLESTKSRKTCCWLLKIVLICTAIGRAARSSRVTRFQRISDMGEHVEQVAVFRVDNLLHLGELVVAEAFLGQVLAAAFLRVSGALQNGAQFFFVLEEVGQFAEEHFHELLRGHRVRRRGARSSSSSCAEWFALLPSASFT